MGRRGLVRSRKNGEEREGERTGRLKVTGRVSSSGTDKFVAGFACC